MIANLPRTARFTPGIVESCANLGPFIDVRYARNRTSSLYRYVDPMTASLSATVRF